MKMFVHPRPQVELLGAAGDESFTWVDPATLVANGITDLFVYCGSAMPPLSYLQAVLAAGISVTFIDEGATDPYAVADPYAAGISRVQAAEAKLAGLYPADCSIVYVLSDQNVSVPGLNDPRVGAHAHGIDNATTRPGWVGYSNRNGIDMARANAPTMRASWVPRTWGANDSDALIQELGSPLDGLDIDTIQIAEWGQWHPGGTPTPPAPAPTGGTRMELVVGQLATPMAIGNVPVPANVPVGLVVMPTGKVHGSWADTNTVYGVPVGAADWHGQPGRGAVPITFVDPTQLAGIIADQVPLDTQALAAAIAAKLPAGPAGGGLTTEQVHQVVVDVLHSVS